MYDRGDRMVKKNSSSKFTLHWSQSALLTIREEKWKNTTMRMRLACIDIRQQGWCLFFVNCLCWMTLVYPPSPPFLYKLWQTDKGFKGWRKVHRLLSGGDRGGRVLWVSPKTGADSTQTSATSAAAAQWDLDRWTQEMSSFRNPTRVPWTHSGVGSMGKVLSVLTRMANNFSLSGGLLGECFSRPFCYCDLWNVGSPELIPKIQHEKHCEKNSPDWHWLSFIGTIVLL